MNTPYNGGPAYPMPTTSPALKTCGLTIRDYFAGQALAGLIQRNTSADYRTTARSAYAFADALLAARTEGKS